MRAFTLISAVALAALPSVFAGFAETVSSTATHMVDLETSLISVESAAREIGNTDIITTAETALSYLHSAQSALKEISASPAFKSNPDAVGSSPEGAAILDAIAKTGNALDALQSEIDSPDLSQRELGSRGRTSSKLKQAFGKCSSHYQGCSGGVTQLCGKPPNKPPHKPPHKPTTTPWKPPHKPTTTPYKPPHKPTTTPWKPPHRPTTTPSKPTTTPSKPTTTPCTTTPHTWGPSQTAGHGGHGGHGGGRGGRGGWRRSTGKSSDEIYCPNSEVACPISSLGSGFECIDTARELTSCGGCSSIGQGQDCTQIPGVAGVGCSSGACVVFSCQVGFTLSKAGTCEPSFNSRIVVA